MSNSKLRKQVCDAHQLGKSQRFPFLPLDRSSEHLFDQYIVISRNHLLHYHFHDSSIILFLSMISP